MNTDKSIMRVRSLQNGMSGEKRIRNQFLTKPVHFGGCQVYRGVRMDLAFPRYHVIRLRLVLAFYQGLLLNSKGSIGRVDLLRRADNCMQFAYPGLCDGDAPCGEVQDVVICLKL